MRFFLLLCVLLSGPALKAQETPASPVLMTLGPIDGESDQKSSIITMRYDSKPGFAKPVVESHGSFLQVILPHTMVLKPGVFVDANSPYVRKFAAFQLDEDTAALRLFVSKEAEHILPAVSTDILENRVVVVIDHARAEKELLANFQGVPVQGGPSSDQVLNKTEVRSDIPDPIQMMEAAKAGPEAPAAHTAAAAPAAAVTPAAEPVALAKATKADAVPAAEAPAEARWADGLEGRLIAVTVFVAVMLLLMIGLKSWRKVAVKTIPPGADFSLKTLATHALGPKQKITVIQVGNEQILLGISPDSINFLTSLNKPAAVTANDLSAAALSASRIAPEGPLLQRSVAPKRREVPETRSAAREEKPEPGSSIRYGISDSGIKNLKEKEQDSLEDVTRMIRKKLKDLPKV